MILRNTIRMAFFFCFQCCLVEWTVVLGQYSKPPLTNSVYNKWTSLIDYGINESGEFLYYRNMSETGEIQMHIYTSDGQHKKTFDQVDNPHFVSNGRYLLYQIRDSIFLYDNKNNKVAWRKTGNDLHFSSSDQSSILTYKRNDTLFLKDLYSFQEIFFSNVDRYWLNSKSSLIILQMRDGLYVLKNKYSSLKKISSSLNVNQIYFDHQGVQFAFSGDFNGSTAIFYYKWNVDSAILKVFNHIQGIESGYKISEEGIEFTPDDQGLIFRLNRVSQNVKSDSLMISSNVTIWSYKDEFLQSQQNYYSGYNQYKTFAAFMPINGSAVFQLETVDRSVYNAIGNKYVLIRKTANYAEAYWNYSQRERYELFSLRNGARLKIFDMAQRITISPQERYVCWFDTLNRHYFTYEISTGETRNVTLKVSGSLISKETNRNEIFPAGVYNWTFNDSSILINDQYDIWQIDPMAIKTPINITSGEGVRRNIVFRFLQTDYNQDAEITRDSLVLVALNEETKDNGFFKVKTGKSNRLDFSRMAPYLYYFPDIQGAESYPLLKAQKNRIYLCSRQNTNEAPNLFVTNDLAKYNQISSIEPHKNYNWMKSELHHWKINDSSLGTGILYKPEDFDSAQSYPIIFHYYEKRSNELHQFKKPALSNGSLDISWYVSNGYLVFIPDIYYNVGATGNDILNIVTSAAEYVRKFKWVNSRKMGLQGHSFGGYETNYIVSHTNIFSAAQSSAGISNLVSEYGGLGFGQQSLAKLLEIAQFNLGVTPWQKPQVYIDNSPIFSVHNIYTPLLLMHDRTDGSVPFAQSVELFTALRRLKKAVWLIEYSGEGHVLTSPEIQQDFTTRQQQFFNYYLKNDVPPIWMTNSIPLEMRKYESGLKADVSGNKP